VVGYQSRSKEKEGSNFKFYQAEQNLVLATTFRNKNQAQHLNDLSEREKDDSPVIMTRAKMNRNFKITSI